MSYHDGYDPRNIGSAPVNPLIKIAQKLKKIQEALENIPAGSSLTANDLKNQIQDILKE